MCTVIIGIGVIYNLASPEQHSIEIFKVLCMVVVGLPVSVSGVRCQWSYCPPLGVSKSFVGILQIATLWAAHRDNGQAYIRD